MGFTREESSPLDCLSSMDAYLPKKFESDQVVLQSIGFDQCDLSTKILISDVHNSPSQLEVVKD